MSRVSMVFLLAFVILATPSVLVSVGEASGKKVAIICCSDDEGWSQRTQDALKGYGLIADRYLVQQIGDLVESLNDYRILYFDVFFAMRGGPLDLSLYRDKLIHWAEEGGIIIFTAITYGWDAKAVSKLGDEFRVTASDSPACDPFDVSIRVRTDDDELKSLRWFGKNWSHMGNDYSPSYQVLAKCEHGNPLLLMQKTGKGRIFVTSSFGKNTWPLVILYAKDLLPVQE